MSTRDLLRREFAEIVAGTRECWSTLAVAQAAEFLGGSDDDIDGCCRALVGAMGIDAGCHAHAAIRTLESRALLFGQSLLCRNPYQGLSS